MIVGIDAASKVIPTEPWVFAPSFQYARQVNAQWGIHESAYNRKALLGITYHVGEDFRHPLSGLRHIDEAIHYLKMHPGDRIGHGLVLGIDLSRWFRMNGIAVMPRMEWLENNLWLWHLITHDGGLAEIAAYVKGLEESILEDARHIYGSLNGITVQGLYQAYASKAKSVTEIREIVEKERKFFKGKIDCFKHFEKADFFPCFREENHNWTENLLALSYHCAYYKQRMNEEVLIQSSGVQERIAECVQNYLLKKIASAGLVIETNPSSNTAIGEMDGVLYHPICHFRDQNGIKVMATVNTDDPSVFNATVANEHALVYYALRNHGMSVEEALREIDTMRETAIRTSFVGNPMSINELLSEYEELLRSLGE